MIPAGIQGNEVDGIFFTEQNISGVSVVKHLDAEISRQNSDLGEVKLRLARQAKNLGANAIMNFKYGQRAHSWWELVLTFKWDTESWHGEGDAVRI